MRPTDPEDTTAKALDLLSPDDPARGDPRLSRDPGCVEITRETQEAAAAVWLATTPLRAAPPDLLPSLMSKIGASASPPRRRYRVAPWLAASGWAAAAAVMLWPRENVAPDPGRMVIAPAAEDFRGEEISPADAPHASTAVSRRERRLRDELLKLQTRLARAEEQALMPGQRVLSLSSPDAVRRTPEEARQRVWSVLTGALRSTLEAESGAPNDPVDLVIERGWLPDAMALDDSSTLIRHRNFPEETWQQLGLLRSEDGNYYDPIRSMVWSPAEDGRGFIGRRAWSDEDLSAFLPPDPAQPGLLASHRSQPEGFVIEDPESGIAEVVIDQLPPTPEGYELMVEWTDTSGAMSAMKVQDTAVVPAEKSSTVGEVVAPTSMTRLASTLVLSLPSTGGMTSFQLVEVPVLATSAEKRVIVSGEQRSKRWRKR